MNESTQATREKLVSDFNAVIADSEELVRSMATASGEKANALRADLERKLRTARERLTAIERSAVDRTKAMAQEADHYVHDHPWESVAVAAAVGGLVGVALGLMLNRR